jgi:hypothetical protein
MAAAFAKSGWNHKLFKRIEELDLYKSQQKKANAYPKQVMVTKCGGEEGSENAIMSCISVYMTCNEHDVHWPLMQMTCTFAGTVLQ